MYEELVKRLRSQCQGYGKECEDCNADGNCRSQMENEAADAIEALSKMEKTTRWIPVTERLPVKGEWVLTYSKYVKPMTDFIGKDGSWHRTPAVTHWMPLPEQPKEET